MPHLAFVSVITRVRTYGMLILRLAGKIQLSPTELLEKPSAGFDSYLRSSKVWLSGKKDIAEKMLKNTSAKTDVKSFFGGLESKLRGPVARKNE